MTELSLEELTEMADAGDANALFELGMRFYEGDGVEQSQENAFLLWKKAATQGLALAQCNLGACYGNGYGVKQSYKKAAEWYKKAAEQGDPDAQLNLGIYYYNGNGVRQSYEKAVQLYKKAAEQGNASAQFCLGVCYEFGEGVEQSYEKAAEWYEKAAEQGDPDAKRSLGNCYYNGNGVEQSYEKAVQWYKKAAELGNPDAQFYLGAFYERGEGVEQSYEKAAEWYEKAAKQGNASAQCYLGYCYYSGSGVEQSFKKAVSWYKKAAKQGDSGAQYLLALCYEGGEGVKQSYNKAAYWYGKAAEQGAPEAQFCLGVCYEFGEGVEQSYEKAVQWYEKAAEQGNASAQSNLGSGYCKGEGVEQSYEKAAYWYGKAAEQGVPEAQLNLGICYCDGNGVEQSYKMAAQWFEKAARQGNASAQFNLALSYENGEGVEQSYEKAAEWYEKAAEQDYAPAQFCLAICYNNGKGVENSPEKALLWLEKAAEQDFPDALCVLGVEYEEGNEECRIEQSFEKALEYYQRAYEKGETGVQEDIDRVKAKIAERDHASLKVDENVDIFLSWNHQDKDEKNALKKVLNQSDIKTWDSDENAEGDLDADVRYAINHSKGYMVLLSLNALESKYMPQEVKMMYERIEKENLNDTIIKVYNIGDPKEIREAIEGLEEGHPFKKLLNLSTDYTSDAQNVVHFAQNVIRKQELLRYQRMAKQYFEVFPIALTDIMVERNNNDVLGSLQFEKGYINRTLYDGDKAYSPKDVLKMGDYLLIYGEGGSGKSLYVKNLIRCYSSDDKVFFYLPCVSILKEIAENHDDDLMSLIARLSFRSSTSKGVSPSLIRSFLDNETKDFYLVLDALDEVRGNEKEVLSVLHAYEDLLRKKHVHVIFTSRSYGDANLISEVTNQSIATLEIRPMSEADIVALFNAIYERNFQSSPDKAPSSNGKGALEARTVSKEYFLKNLPLLADDIKKNPLLISNLIYIYFATKKLETHRSYILEKSNDIILDYLEKERGTLAARNEVLKRLQIKIRDVLEFLAFHLTKDKEASVETILHDFLKLRKGEEPDDEDVDALCRYLRARRILAGNRFAHEIYCSYFAARFFYNKTYEKVVDEDFGEDYITFLKGEKDGYAYLCKCAKKFFSLELGLWPSVTVDFLSKLDYEMHQILENRDGLDPEDLSYDAFDRSMKAVSSSISKIAKDVCLSMCEKDCLFYYASMIKGYLE